MDRPRGTKYTYFWLYCLFSFICWKRYDAFMSPQPEVRQLTKIMKQGHAAMRMEFIRRRPTQMGKLSKISSLNASTKVYEDEYTPVQQGSLGAPRYRPLPGRYLTKGGVQVSCNVVEAFEANKAVNDLIDALDTREGVVLASSYEYPGRYARWTVGFVDPPLKLEAKGKDFKVKALNQRGKVLLAAIESVLLPLATTNGSKKGQPDTASLEWVKVNHEKTELSGRVKTDPTKYFSEEERSKQPSIFSVVRAIVNLFRYDDDAQLGLYGSFGYDLTFQFESVRMRHDRKKFDQRDLVLYLPDQILVQDLDKGSCWRLDYDFTWNGVSTSKIPRPLNLKTDAHSAATGADTKGKAKGKGTETPVSESEQREWPVGSYAAQVLKAKEEFKRGNLFEVVTSQTFTTPCTVPPSKVFRRLLKRNPSPYGFFMNLGMDNEEGGGKDDGEYLVGASPEMFVRCENSPLGLRVETCPISGTIARGQDALEDAANIQTILSSKKEESELTMCTDVDRNDKSRICVPGSVKVIGRRQIEKYSRLIHTVDHVEGYLRPGFDGLDAFLCHTWAVTVTGAPKAWAIQFIEDHEASPRAWYGGAVGIVKFDGGINTGLTLRTVWIKRGRAHVRAGATLLFDSVPSAEEKETELKASAVLDAVLRASDKEKEKAQEKGIKGGEEEAITRERFLPKDLSLRTGKGKLVLLIDHEDSFVHTLANYLRQTGAEVVTVRSGPTVTKILSLLIHSSSSDQLKKFNLSRRPDLVVLSPGPGSPTDFKISQTLDALVALKMPTFGVCLGLQGIVEHFGGKLGVLSYPMHGKESKVLLHQSAVQDSKKNIFESLGSEFQVARYHSLYGLREEIPESLAVLASTEDGIVMAVEHKKHNIAGVQFHPESILTNPSTGLRIIANCLKNLCARLH